MATTADFVVVHSDASWANRAIDAAMAELTRVEQLMTRFRATSDIGRANSAAMLAPVTVSRDSHAVIGQAPMSAGSDMDIPKRLRRT
jgi:thiamine biosynthesis lipoprotein